MDEAKRRHRTWAVHVALLGAAQDTSQAIISGDPVFWEKRMQDALFMAEQAVEDARRLIAEVRSAEATKDAP